MNEWAIKIVNLSLLVFIAQLCFFINGGWSIFLFLTFFPFVLLCSFVIINENLNIITSINRTLELLKSNYGLLFGIYAIIFMVAGLGYFFMNSPFSIFYLDFFKMNLSADIEMMNLLMVILNAIISVFSMLVVIPLFLFAYSFLYFSLKEITHADGLMASLKRFGNA
jgi:hypothetical protein